MSGSAESAGFCGCAKGEAATAQVENLSRGTWRGRYSPSQLSKPVGAREGQNPFALSSPPAACMAGRFLRRKISFPGAKIVPLQFLPVSHTVRMKIGGGNGRRKIRRVLRFRQRRSGYSSSREFEPRHLAGKIFPIPAVKTRRSARGPRSFRAFIAPGGMYGRATRFLPWKRSFPGAKIVSLQFSFMSA